VHILAIRGSKNDFAIHDFAKKLNWRLLQSADAKGSIQKSY